ncbi:MAG: hypothetical protein JSV91_05040, partial [Phycisphaerales bacterium]
IWLAMAGDHFTVTSFYSDEDWSPTVQFLNLYVMMGAYVMPGVGWYYEIEPNLILRDGGHAVSVASGARNGNIVRMGIRDPGSAEGDPTRQSPFTTETYDAESVFAKRIGVGEIHLWNRLPCYGGDGKVGYLDGFTAIHPLFVVATHPTTPGMIVKRYIPDLYGMAVPVVQEWETPDQMSVDSMAVHVDLSSIVYVAQGLTGWVFWSLNFGTGLTEPIDLSFDNPREVMVSRLRELFVLDGDDLVRVAIDVKPPLEEGRITPPSTMCAMAYEDETDELILLSPGDQTIHRYLYNFDCPPDVKSIVPEIPLSENASICWDPTREAIWVASDASNSLFMLVDNGQQIQSDEFFHPVLIDPVDKIDAHDGGHIFVSCGGMLYEFELVGKGLELVDDPLFPDMQVGEQFCIARSHTNYDEDLHSGEEWRDVLPENFADPTDECPEDLNGDGKVDIDDLFAVLGAWGPCPPDEFCEADF